MSQTSESTTKPRNQRNMSKASPIPVPAFEALTHTLSPEGHRFDAGLMIPAMNKTAKRTFQTFSAQVIFRHRNGFMSLLS